MKQRPLIAIPGWSTGDLSFGVGKAYLNHLGNFGDVIMLTPMNGIIENVDLVVLPGGSDAPSFLYGQPPGYFNTASDQFKEWFVQSNLTEYIEAGVPVWGTCLGFQNLLIKYGGSLCQNLIGHPYSEEERGELVHELVFTGEYKLLEAKLLARRANKKVTSIKTCSLHHQGAYESNVPDCFNIVAKTKDGVVECIEHKTLPIAGMQSHTEEDWNALGNHLISKLLHQSPNFKYENSGSNSSVSSGNSK